jgi:hypothetical protein
MKTIIGFIGFNQCSKPMIDHWFWVGVPLKGNPTKPIIICNLKVGASQRCQTNNQTNRENAINDKPIFET